MVDTERAILQAAKVVFLKKGLAGASMKDIADETGMSRTLLHYYYRKKETLFRAILLDTVNEIIPRIGSIIETDLPLIVKIERVIDVYLDLLIEDPLIPHFMLMEVQRDPQALVALIRSHSTNFGSLQRIQQQIHDEMKTELLGESPLAHLFISMYGPLLFPFLARPALNEVFFEDEPDAFPQFMREQKVIAMEMLRGLFKEPHPKSFVESTNEAEGSEERIPKRRKASAKSDATEGIDCLTTG
jgi:Transcriptional regulator